MIFFRTHKVKLKLQRGDESFFLFGDLKASFSAPIDKLSGMAVNLKDVDSWMSQAQTEAPAFHRIDEVLRFYFQSLKVTSKNLKNVELFWGPIKYEYDGEQLWLHYYCRTWFKQDNAYVQRAVKLKSKNPISREWRSRLARKKWSGVEAFAKLLKQKLSGIQDLQIQKPEWNGWERYDLSYGQN